MVRIAGVELPDDKRIDFALTKIYGIGWKTSLQLLNASKISPAKKVKELNNKELSRLSQIVEKKEVEGELRRRVKEAIARLRAIGAYRGIRHARNLPVRGQRTRSNARTKRGARKTVGAFRKEVLAKMQQQAKTEGEEQ